MPHPSAIWSLVVSLFVVEIHTNVVILVEACLCWKVSQDACCTSTMRCLLDSRFSMHTLCACHKVAHCRHNREGDTQQAGDIEEDDDAHTAFCAAANVIETLPRLWMGVGPVHFDRATTICHVLDDFNFARSNYVRISRKYNGQPLQMKNSLLEWRICPLDLDDGSYRQNTSVDVPLNRGSEKLYHFYFRVHLVWKLSMRLFLIWKALRIIQNVLALT